MKNLFLPGTNKNVGYLDKNKMCIYKRCVKYFALPPIDQYLRSQIDGICQGANILTQRDKKGKETSIQLTLYDGYFYNVETGMYEFNNCQFKTPDNLDLIERAYLYQHWKVEKGG